MPDGDSFAGGTYPCPTEDDTNKEIIIHLTVATNDDFDKNWDYDKIKEYVKENYKDYIYDGDIDIEEIEIY